MARVCVVDHVRIILRAGRSLREGMVSVRSIATPVTESQEYFHADSKPLHLAASPSPTGPEVILDVRYESPRTIHFSPASSAANSARSCRSTSLRRNRRRSDDQDTGLD